MKIRDTSSYANPSLPSSISTSWIAPDANPVLSWLRPSHHWQSSYRLRADVWVHGLMSGWQLQLTVQIDAAPLTSRVQRAQPPMLLCACVLPPEMHHKYAEPPGKGLATRDASSATDVAMRMRPPMRHMYAEPLWSTATDAPHVRRATRVMSCHQRCATCTPSH